MKPDSKIQLLIEAHAKDLGGFEVHRVLPYASHRMVGPFIFLDHMGPAHFKPGDGINVRPHPHINLATVTYLFEGKIHHRDSLGSDQMIEPGAINWMTAGAGIVHSERCPEELRASGNSLNGIQLWVALPEAAEEIAPSFVHHPKEAFSEFKIGDVTLKLLLGEIFDRRSPVKTHSDIFYVEARMPRGSTLTLPVSAERESGAYVVKGKLKIAGQDVSLHEMAVGEDGKDLVLEATEDSHVMLLGGKHLGPRHIFWNFVSSSQARIEEAKALWKNGPRSDNARFKPIPGDDAEFIPLT
ncbi:MAG: pirin family protein [Bdellovibrionota bacterium]